MRGVKEIAAAVRDNVTLETLELSIILVVGVDGNWIGDEGFRHVAEMLEHNYTLLALSLSSQRNYFRIE